VDKATSSYVDLVGLKVFSSSLSRTLQNLLERGSAIVTQLVVVW
jgi:hypothetical protein